LIASTIAFMVWALAVPPLVTTDAGKIVAAFRAVLVSTVLSLVGASSNRLKLDGMRGPERGPLQLVAVDPPHKRPSFAVGSYQSVNFVFYVISKEASRCVSCCSCGVWLPKEAPIFFPVIPGSANLIPGYPATVGYGNWPATV